MWKSHFRTKQPGFVGVIAVAFLRFGDIEADREQRNVSAISVDPTNANHAFISYNAFSTPNGVNGPPTIAPGGHVIEATYNAGTGQTTFVDRSYDLGDIPVTGIAFDNVTGDVYAATDFGVLRLAAGTTSWAASAPGMPRVEVAGLTIVPGARKLYAATHGLGAWLLNLN